MAARVRGDEFVADAAGEPGGLDVEFRDDGLEVVIGLGNGLGVEGVGLDDVGPGFEKAAVDVGDDVGPGQDEEVAVALEVLGMAGKALAAEIGLRELELLQGGAHRAVDDDDALLQKRFEGMHGNMESLAGQLRWAAVTALKSVCAPELTPAQFSGVAAEPAAGGW
jgi:hypothetical protein